MNLKDNQVNVLTQWLKWRGWLWIIWIGGIILVLLQVEFRPLDRDEGFYLFGAWRVFLGETPYLEFFYPQAPYMPYIYAPVVGLFRDGVLGGRLLSALCTVALAVLCAIWVGKRSGNKHLGTLAGGLMLFGNLTLYWHSAVKTYALSDLLLVAGFVSLMAGFRTSQYLRIFFLSVLSGVLFGLSFHIRLVLAGAIPYLLLLAILSPGFGKAQRFLGLVGGMAIASVPAFLLLLSNPQLYWFNNLTFHITARLPQSFWQFVGQKISALGAYLGSPDIIVLYILCIVGLSGLSRTPALTSEFKREVWMGIGLAGVLFATYLTAPPLLPQYLIQLSPFLVFGAIAGVAITTSEKKGSSGPLIVLLLLLIYGGWGAGKAAGRIAQRQDVASLYGTETVRQVGNTIGNITTKREQVLAFWPAYLVSARRNPIPGTGFGSPSFRLEWRNPPEAVHKVGLKTRHDYREMIENLAPEVVIAGFDVPTEFLPLIQEHYCLDREINGVKIYLRPEMP
jgi:hypothetical protein